MSAGVTQSSPELNLLDRLQIKELQELYRAAPKNEVKYAQPCTGGMYMGVVHVHLQNKINNGMRFGGDGRIYKKDVMETQTTWFDNTPKVCKYVKIKKTDKPPDYAPQVIDLEFEFVVYTGSANGLIYTDATNGVERPIHIQATSKEQNYEYDEEMGKEQNYEKCTAKITLQEPRKLDDQADGYFFSYTCKEINTENIPSMVTRVYADKYLRPFIKGNKYIFEFQKLNAHPNMPGLFFAPSIGHPSDRLAVLSGGRARASTYVIRKNETVMNGDFFAQYKFDNTQWYTLKIIHAAMANVLSKVEYMYNYVLEIPELSTVQKLMTKNMCHVVLDEITKPYVDAVLQNMELTSQREDEPIKISKIREACEYVFLKKYPFLNTLHWNRVDGICTLSGRFELDVESTSNFYNIRAIGYKVVSSVLEPGKINVFSAHDVFKAYVECYYADEVPEQFNEVLEDAKQLALNIKYLKTSSNFAVVRLTKSCKRAVEHDENFGWFSACMLEASKKFISLLLQRLPSAHHPNFSEYISTKADKLHENELSARTTVSVDVETFEFTDNVLYAKKDITVDQLQYLVLATQLGVLAGMRRAETEGNFEAETFDSKIYFEFLNTHA